MGKKKKNKSKKTTAAEQKASNTKDLFRGVWAVITNKQDTQGEFTKGTFVLLMSCLLNMCAIMLGLFSVIGLCVAVYEVFALNWSTIATWINNLTAFIIMLFLCVLSFLFAVMLRGFANEVEREEDKNYIIALFSGIVSFVALIISLIALLRG
jgi:hypothetical protein